MGGLDVSWKKAAVKGVAPVREFLSQRCLLFNDKAGVRPETRAKVLDTIHRLGYVPNGAAVRPASRERFLRQRSTRQVRLRRYPYH